MLGFVDAVASAGPYANDLHLAPDRVLRACVKHAFICVDFALRNLCLTCCSELTVT